MTGSRWRARARAVIAATLAAYDGDMSDLGAIRKALPAAYPFGPREHHPYKIWLSEVAATLKRLKPVEEQKSDPASSGPLFGGEQ